MEQLIKRLNDTSNRPSPDEVRDIERRIQSLLRESSGWGVGFDLLANEHPLLRFYGALTLTIKINADWFVLYPLLSRPHVFPQVHRVCKAFTLRPPPVLLVFNLACMPERTLFDIYLTHPHD